jgi:hypothetical protein
VNLENKNYKNIFISFLMGIFLSIIPIVIHSDAYCRDDMQVQYMPTFYAIGSTILHAHLVPFITTHTWFGGNLIGEFQYGILNPIELALYSILPFIKSIQYGADFIAVFHYGILSSGMFFLAKTLGVSDKFSYVAAATAVTNNFIYYWYASSWFPQFTSISFMVWAIAFTLRANQSKWYFLAAIISIYLMVTIGFPQTIVAFTTFGLVYSFLEIFKYKNIQSYLPLFAVGLGGMSALISFLPSVAMLTVSDRNVTSLFSAGSLIPQLGDLFFFSNPVHPSHMVMMSYRHIKASHFYVAWFILPALFFIDWKAVRSVPTKFVSIIVCMFVFLVLTQGPEHLGPLRLPFRYMAFFQIFLVLTVLYFFDHYKKKHTPKYKSYCFAGTLFMLDMISCVQFPNKCIYIGISFILCLYFGLRIAQKNMSVVQWIIITIVFTVFSRGVGGFHNGAMPDWQIFPRISAEINLNSVDPYYNIYLVDNIFNKKWYKNSDQYIKDIGLGNVGLARNDPSINGYSPMQPSGLSRRFFSRGEHKASVHGTTSMEAGIRGLEIEPVTGLSFFDLMRVKNVIAFNGEQADTFDREKTAEWRKTENREYATVFSHSLPNEMLPGSLSWPLQGVSVAEQSVATGTHEAMTLSLRSKNAHKLIFARTYWPGYEATFNGATVPVSAFAGFMLSVDLPADASAGKLELFYHVPYLKLSTFLFMLSVLMTASIMNIKMFWRKI